VIGTLVRIGSWARTAAGWIADRPLLVLLIMTAIVAGWRGIELREARTEIGKQRALAAQWQADFIAQREEMRKFATLVREARKQAAKDDAANIKRVEGEWSAKLEKQSDDYQSSLAAALAGVDRRMRNGQAGKDRAGAACSGRDAELPRLSILPDGPLPAGGAAIISRADALICVGNTVRLEALIAAWKDAASINVNGQ